MLRRACVIAMVVAACSPAEPRGSLTGPPDAVLDGDDSPVDADPTGPGTPDAGRDATPGPGNPDAAVIDAAAPDPDAAVTDTELAAACGGAVPVTFDDWENCYRRRRCQFEVGCIPQNAYHDVQECLDSADAVAGGQLSAELRERRRAVEEGRAAINAATFRQCVIDTSAAHCNTTQSSVSCALRFTGTRGDNAACDADVECASPGATCVSTTCTDACCTGSTCRPKFKEGQPCHDDNTGSSCEPGLQCHRTCIAGNVNTPCTADRDCDTSAWCDQLAGLCRADFAPGAECDNPLQCGGETSCVGISIVTTNPGHCLRISHPGDHCDFFCYGNLFCNGSGTCQALPELGDSCPGFSSCSGVDTLCNASGICSLRSGVNASCAQQPCLPGLFGTSELNANDPMPTCAPRRKEGERCAQPSHCESYLCSGNNAQSVCLAWRDTCPLSGN